MSKRTKMITFILIIFVIIIIAINVLTKESFVIFGEERSLPIYCVDTDEKKVAISFDAAWGDEFTMGILDTLDDYNVKATFFLVKFWAEKYPDDVKTIFERGHDIGNHSSTHPDMASLSKEQIMKELDGTSQVIENITGIKPNLFRPPFGSYSNTLIKTCEEMGYSVIQWNIDSLDWKDISAEQIQERVMRNITPGSIILFHNNAQHVLKYLPSILEALKNEGYSVIKINDLIYQSDFHIDHSGKQIQGS